MDGSSRPSRRRGRGKQAAETRVGASASNGQARLRSYQVGALPLLNHYFERLGLADILRRHLPPDDARQEIPTERIALLLVRNVLVSREPMYAVPDWAARHSPELFDLFHADVPLLHDDRLGACLAKLFAGATPELILAVVRDAIDRFQVSLDELHNDSTSVSFHGQYPAAASPRTHRGRQQPAITWGHSKDHRPDLKQLLFTLTLTSDGGVPVCFNVDSGNTNDDVTHRRSWDLLASLAGRPDFLYVADCKLASRENLAHIAHRGGRFITVLPRERREDVEFRRRLREQPDSIPWEICWTRVQEPDDPLGTPGSRGEPADLLRGCSEEQLTKDGYRLLWFHSQRKAELDEQARARQCQRAIQELEALQGRLAAPRTRFRQLAQVEREVSSILSRRQAELLLQVEIIASEEEEFRKEGRGRPTRDSRYRREVRNRFELKWSLDHIRWQAARAEDGVFPLLTNDRALSPRQVLEAYKRQPTIEKRFSQLKSDYQLAPVFLKSPPRVVGLFTVYFLALLTQALIERDLRRALADSAAQAPKGERRWEGSIDAYPEGRRTRRPTTRHVLDMLESVRRYELWRPDQDAGDEPLLLFDDLTPSQERLLRLLGVNPDTYGR